ncbi:MAG TPA: YnbE family lipoprotein [Stellaceae bacterium]|nr:YnbE family lipoprotein [Stellaceae bacterium]
MSDRRVGLLGILLLGACTPTVAVEAPKEPITINLNIKLDANVRLEVEEKAKQDVETKSIF